MEETRLVERLAAIGWHGSAAVDVGPGDDAALLRGGLVVSTDLMVEDVHFSRDWISPADAGFRAAAAALSDLAAMGAAPEALLVSLALPGDDLTVGEEVQRGVRAAGDRVSAPVVGGDVSRSPRTLVLDVVAVGRAHGTVVKRSGAEPGHDLWVSGVLGGAAAAVAAWSRGASPEPEALRRFTRPPDRTGLGRALAARELCGAMIDVSDGLLADARRLARASEAGLRVLQDRVPVDETAGGDLNQALEGGEDYELMFTAHPGAKSRILALGRELSVQLTRIGSVGEGTGVVVEDPEGRRRIPGPGGYDHFAAPPGAPR